MTTSIERDVENSLALALATASVTGVNIYTSTRNEPRLMPYVSIESEINSEEIAPFTGIFDLTATLTFVARADTSSNQGYDNKFFEIQQAFYTEPNIASQMTTDSEGLEFYIADITRVNQRIVSASRTWAKEIIFNIKATSISKDFRSLEFDDFMNSQYLAVI
jgi:hypothetical protein